MEEVINRLMKEYDLSRDDVINKLSPEYDLSQTGNHDGNIIAIHGVEYKIDKKLTTLFQLINKYDMNTYTSCQHNKFGWASVGFTVDGYQRFLDKIVEKARAKHNNDRNKVCEMNIIDRYSFNTLLNKNNRVNVMCEIFCGLDYFHMSIHYKFKQSEIPILESELKELFDD